MSRSEPVEHLQNPATRFFEIKGDGKIYYYDKETKENVNVKAPFRFLVLDEVSQVGGGVKDRSGEYKGFWSNAVKNSDDILTVRSGHNGHTQIVAEGTWAEVKASLVGAKYVKGLYIGYYNDDKELSIGYLKLKGASLSAWFEFNKDRRRIDVGAFTVKGRSDELTNGNTVYYEPVFDWTDNVKEDTEEAAIALDVELQAYLKPYLAKGVTEAPTLEPLPEPEYSGGDEYAPDTTQVAPDDDEDSDSIPF
jgi:hypothetical protein